MFGIIISDAWPQYYSSSPFKNFLDIPTKAHPDFEIIPMNSSKLESEEFRESVKKFSALVVDEVWVSHMSFYTQGPILMIDGDPHRHDQAAAWKLESKYNLATYVLTGAHEEIKHPRYYYPKEEIRKQKFLYFPHFTPGIKCPDFFWEQKTAQAALSGSISEVYPFRKKVSDERFRNVYTIPFQSSNHFEYFNKMSLYMAGITCPSIFYYTVAKYFEIPWCGSVLMAPKPAKDEAALLGMIDNVNVLFVEDLNTLRIWLQDISSLKPIAEKGRELMLNRHTVFHRLEYLSSVIKKILSGNFSIGDEKTIFTNIGTSLE